MTKSFARGAVLGLAVAFPLTWAVTWADHTRANTSAYRDTSDDGVKCSGMVELAARVHSIEQVLRAKVDPTR
jgi:hypothetical protein